MNLGQTILELRKKKKVTQEEIAAELGVTAAAVSKWENGYTLPDILMLCALADYFQVTTDELLGRNVKERFAVIAANSMVLGHKIAATAQKYGIIIHGIYEDFPAAARAAHDHREIRFILVSLNRPQDEKQYRCVPDSVQIIESNNSDESKILSGFDIFLSHLN